MEVGRRLNRDCREGLLLDSSSCLAETFKFVVVFLCLHVSVWFDCGISVHEYHEHFLISSYGFTRRRLHLKFLLPHPAYTVLQIGWSLVRSQLESVDFSLT